MIWSLASGLTVGILPYKSDGKYLIKSNFTKEGSAPIATIVEFPYVEWRSIIFAFFCSSVTVRTTDAAIDTSLSEIFK